MWPNSQFPVDLVTFTEEIFNGKLHLLWSTGEGWVKQFTSIISRINNPFHSLTHFMPLIFFFFSGYRKKPVISNGLTTNVPITWISIKWFAEHVKSFQPSVAFCINDWFYIENKWLVSIWNATLGWNGLIDWFLYDKR